MIKQQVVHHDSIDIVLVCNDGTEKPAHIALYDISTVAPFENHNRIVLTFANSTYQGEGYCYFSALKQLRLQLEPLGLIPKLNGASIDCYPSNMSSEMSSGRVIYKQTLGKQALSADWVQTFEHDAISQLATVAEQLVYRNKWLLSLGIEPF